MPSLVFFFFFFSSRRRHTMCGRDWSSDVCSSDLLTRAAMGVRDAALSLGKSLRAAPGRIAKTVATVRSAEFQTQVKADLELIGDIAKGRMKERFGPLLDRLAHRAVLDR